MSLLACILKRPREIFSWCRWCPGLFRVEIMKPCVMVWMRMSLTCSDFEWLVPSLRYCLKGFAVFKAWGWGREVTEGGPLTIVSPPGSGLNDLLLGQPWCKELLWHTSPQPAPDRNPFVPSPPQWTGPFENGRQIRFFLQYFATVIRTITNTLWLTESRAGAKPYS